MRVSAEAATAWLGQLGTAWENRDATAFAVLFAPTAIYHWTPFCEPQCGREEIATAFDAAVARQRDVHFVATPWAVDGDVATAHWHCTYTRVPTG